MGPNRNIQLQDREDLGNVWGKKSIFPCLYTMPSLGYLEVPHIEITSFHMSKLFF